MSKYNLYLNDILKNLKAEGKVYAPKGVPSVGGDVNTEGKDGE